MQIATSTIYTSNLPIKVLKLTELGRVDERRSRKKTTVRKSESYNTDDEGTPQKKKKKRKRVSERKDLRRVQTEKRSSKRT